MSLTKYQVAECLYDRGHISLETYLSVLDLLDEQDEKEEE